jgi:hypothetical protein
VPNNSLINIKMRTYNIYIGEQSMPIFEHQVTGIFTDSAAKLIRKVSRQGGKIVVSIGSIKPRLREQFQAC